MTEQPLFPAMRDMRPLDREDQRRWLNIVLQRHVRGEQASALASRLDMELQREGLRLTRIEKERS